MITCASPTASTTPLSLPIMAHLSPCRRVRLPLEGGGWNATDLDRRSHRTKRTPTGELSPMAFLVGVTLPLRHPHPARHDHLAPFGGVSRPVCARGRG